MNDCVLAAAENNARWCDIVCRSHDIPTAFEDGHWAALRRPPERIPDAVTLVPGATAADVLRSVQDGPGCSVKDSFADLDLASHGFAELFEARWIFRGPALPTVAAAEVWSVVEREDELAEWLHAAGAADRLRGEILGDPSVRVLVARGPGGIQAGAIATRSASVVGVSDVFTIKPLASYKAWTSLTTAVSGQFPWVPMVGYERGEALQAALSAGFAETGSVRVWSRPATA